MKGRQQDMCKIVEKLTGVASLFSVLLFLLRFSPICKYVVPACYVFDILFVMLIFLRFKLYGAVEYLGTWQNIVDLLSAVPVAVLFARHSPLFQFIMPLGCFSFFRLLNIIPPVKDSLLAKKHFQHICFIIIVVEVAAALTLNVFFRSYFDRPLIESYTAEYERFPSNPEYLMKDDENVILVYKNGTIQSRKGFIRDKKTHSAICNSSSEYLIKIRFSEGNVVSDGKINAPKCGIIVKSPELFGTFNCLMLLMLLPAVIMFAVILLRDILSKDAKRLAVAAEAVQSGIFSAFDEELKAVGQGSKDEIAQLYQSIDSARHNFSPKTEKLEATELAETAEPLEAETVAAAAEATKPMEAESAITEAETEAIAGIALPAQVDEIAPVVMAEPVVVEPEQIEAAAEIDELESEIAEAENVEQALPVEAAEAELNEPVELAEAAEPLEAEPVELAEAVQAEPATAAESVEAEPEIEPAEIAEAAPLEPEAVAPVELVEAAAPADDEAEPAEAVPEIAEPLELAEAQPLEVEPETAVAETIEEAVPFVEHEPPRSGGLLALALK